MPSAGADAAFRLLAPLSIGPGFGQRPLCEVRADDDDDDDGPEGATVPFVRPPHFHFVWVLSGPLTVSLEFLDAARAWVGVGVCLSWIYLTSSQAVLRCLVLTTYRRSRHSALSKSTWRRLGWHVKLGLNAQGQGRRHWACFVRSVSWLTLR